MKKRVHMTRAQTWQAGKLLEEHSTESEGTRAFNDGWSDAQIAEIVRTDKAPITSAHISDMRRDLYPDWRLREIPKKEPARDDLLSMIEDLQNRVADLEGAARQRRTGVVRDLLEPPPSRARLTLPTKAAG